MADGLLRTAAALLAAVLLLACGDGGSRGDGAAAAGGEAELVARGERVFLANCTACHATDPGVDGPIGPPLAGSSLELLRAKVIHGEYPPGYVPQRETSAMVPLPHVEPDLPALAAYLASVEREG